MRAQDEAGKTDLAIGVVTNMIGALTMSRLVDDPQLSDRILAATRRRIEDAFDLPAAQEPKPKKKSAKQ